MLYFNSTINCGELDLSCCTIISDECAFLRMQSMRSLRLDNTSIGGEGLRKILSSSKRLLKLSIRGCSEVTRKDIHSAKSENDYLGLLELDCTDITEGGVSLSSLREHFPTLLKLNNRCTGLGTKLLKAHQTSYLWRVGGGNSSSATQRKPERESPAEFIEREESSFLSNYCCSILRTGFSQSVETEQEMFACRTCGIEMGRFVCLNCSSNCHKDHDVRSVGYGPGYCDCCIFSTCTCLNRDEW